MTATDRTHRYHQQADNACLKAQFHHLILILLANRAHCMPSLGSMEPRRLTIRLPTMAKAGSDTAVPPTAPVQQQCAPRKRIVHSIGNHQASTGQPGLCGGVPPPRRRVQVMSQDHNTQVCVY